MGFIELVEVGYAFPGGRTLFDKVSFKVPDGARVGLVGANGVGKTTLLWLIADPDEGHRGLIRVIGRLARMPQMIHDPKSPITLRELLITQAPVGLARVGAALVAGERGMQANPTEAAGIAYADAVHQWGELGGYDLEVDWNAACMAATGEPFEAIGARVANTFSGGELKRILLDALFRSNAEVVLLDEPDNFLDVIGKEWLEVTMSASRKTLLYISHDREFLGNTSTQIVTLEAHGTWTHPASFASYEEARRSRIAGLEEDHRRYQEQRSALIQTLKEYRYFSQLHDSPHLARAAPLAILTREGLDRTAAMGTLRRYELDGAADVPFEKLSGGQQARLQILVLEVRGSTMLVLDEPTDNLDVASADALEYALWQYEGTILAVTHDRWLLKSFQRFLVFGSDGLVKESDDPTWA